MRYLSNRLGKIRQNAYGLGAGISCLPEGLAFVEHVFARQKGPMGMFIRTIGLARATTKIGLANLTYNMKRMIWLTDGLATA
jgi:hypothetical protein